MKHVDVNFDDIENVPEPVHRKRCIEEDFLTLKTALSGLEEKARVALISAEQYIEVLEFRVRTLEHRNRRLTEENEALRERVDGNHR